MHAPFSENEKPNVVTRKQTVNHKSGIRYEFAKRTLDRPLKNIQNIMYNDAIRTVFLRITNFPYAKVHWLDTYIIFYRFFREKSRLLTLNRSDATPREGSSHVTNILLVRRHTHFSSDVTRFWWPSARSSSSSTAETRSFRLCLFISWCLVKCASVESMQQVKSSICKIKRYAIVWESQVVD